MSDAESDDPRLVHVTTCQLCGSDRSTLHFAEPPYKVLRCDGCGLVYVTPRWSDDALREVYGEDYWRSDSPKTKGYADYASEAELYLKTFRRRTRLVRRYLPTDRPARILDVGCAAGYFLRVMQDLGHDVRGVEVSEAIAGDAQASLGAERVWVGTLDSVPREQPGFEPGSFDLVSMWDVIEHVPDPQQLLRDALAMLRPTGHLLIETQNVDSRFANVLGPKWHHYKHEEHIYHFNPHTIRMVLDQAGFDVARLTSAFGGKYVSFGFIAERAARLNRLASLALKPLAAFKRANVYLNFRDEMVVVAKPKAAATA
ncbi:MAG: class I SAM-dependent methyltransferase [Planctomycetes bacterium]|nr:class I SAM-dependent methyltransferase [Planctomycetota bacterium]